MGRSRRHAKPPAFSPVIVHPTTHVPKRQRREYVRHPMELDYLTPNWSDGRFVKYLTDHAFTIPPLTSINTTGTSLVQISGVDGTVTAIPQAYRLPLLIVACDLWSCFEDLILYEHDLWESHKFDLLHLSRLCTTFLSQARASAITGTLDGSWRCPTLDRFLTRIYLHWFSNRDEWVEKFSKDWGEEIYATDPLKKDWTKWINTKPKGLTITRDQVIGGITAKEFTHPCRRVTIKEGKIIWKATGFGFRAARDGVHIEAEGSVVETADLAPTDEQEIQMDETEELAVSRDAKELTPEEQPMEEALNNATPGPIESSAAGRRLSGTPITSNSRSSSALRESAALAEMQETLQTLQRKHSEDIQQLLQAFTASSQAVQEELRLLRAEVRQRSDTPKSERTRRSSSMSDRHDRPRRDVVMRDLEDVEEFDVEDMYL